MSGIKALRRPNTADVRIKDGFWRAYIEKIHHVTLPYVLGKFEEIGYINNFALVAGKGEGGSRGPDFADGLLFEVIRGACELLISEYDAKLDAELDRIIAVVNEAAKTSTDGFLCTSTMLKYTDKRFGENGGNLIHQHDIYDQGALVEAAIAHYKATKKVTLLRTAVLAANCIAKNVAERNIIPGHSLPEEAFVKLYRLFRDCRELDGLAGELNVNPETYLKTAELWYDGRGRRSSGDNFSFGYNQNHLPFAHQTTAEGHAVRAALCYTGACAVAREAGRIDFIKPLNEIWRNITKRKLHISGGIGTRHDIEGFDLDYNLPNNAYLETCAAIALAFFAGELATIQPGGDKFDVFELALYNNILDAISEDGTHFFYQNPLVGDGNTKRWEWHGCPCCPPMLIKLYGALGSYIYMLGDGEVYVNMLIDSEIRTDEIELSQSGGLIVVGKAERPFTLKIRIPWYVGDFKVTLDGVSVGFKVDNGYAVVENVSAESRLCVSFEEKVRRICANTRVRDDLGSVAIMHGKQLMCAEEIDNGGDIEFTVAENPDLRLDGDCVVGKRADGGSFRLIPYYRWAERDGAGKMRVWFAQENMKSSARIENTMQEELYYDYEKIM